MGPEYLGEGAININEIAGSSLRAVNDLPNQNFLSQQIESASRDLGIENLKMEGSEDAKKEEKLKILDTKKSIWWAMSAWGKGLSMRYPGPVLQQLMTCLNKTS